MRYWTLEYTVDPAVIAKLAPQSVKKTTGWLLFNFPAFENEQRILMVSQIENNRRELLPTCDFHSLRRYQFGYRSGDGRILERRPPLPKSERKSVP